MPTIPLAALAHAGPRDVARARRLFFESNADPQGLVPEVIVRSWRRCLGHVHEQSAPPEPVAALALAQRRETRGRLRRHALPELEALAEALSSTGTVALLSDAQGMILDAVGGDAFLPRAERVALRPGVDWSEAQRGTNAIGTALVEQRAVTVLGHEHYVDANRTLGCTAVPLRSPDGSLQGVLDVSGDPRAIGASLAALARLAAGLIEHRVALDPAPGVAVLRFARDAAMLGSHREALVWVRDGEIIGANRAAVVLLGTELDAMRGRAVDTLFGRLPGLQRGGPPGRLQDHAGRASFSACWQLPEGGTDRGRPWRPSGAGMSKARATSDVALVMDASDERAVERAARVLDAGLAVLVRGETGVGKEVFTRRLHARCARRGGPLVAVNCAALPEGLIEAELFGYEEGAFTGARRQGRIGRIREAHGGVLFLDEIGDMPLALQARLLRVLQDRQVQPLGGGRPTEADFALVCATHRDLKAMAGDGRFRADLLFRLQDHVVELPALRLRPDRDALVSRLALDVLSCGGQAIAQEALDALCAYAWPGNLRQLASTLRALAALAEPGSVIGLEDLPGEVRAAGTAAEDDAPRDPARVQADPRSAGVGTPRAPASAGPSASAAQPLRHQAAAAIDAALAACGGNVSAAARRLGLHRSTVHRHLQAQHRIGSGRDALRA